MGSNESLSPPPPRGQPIDPSPIAPGPPAHRLLPPSAYDPLTRQLPPVSPFRSRPPGLAAAAVIVAGALVQTGRNDDKTVTPQSTSVSTVFASIPNITMPTDSTLVITAPVITVPDMTAPEIAEPPITEPPITVLIAATTVASGAGLTDDTGVFAVVLPAGLDLDTSPITTHNNLAAVYLQGSGPSSDLLPRAQMVFETIRLL